MMRGEGAVLPALLLLAGCGGGARDPSGTEAQPSAQPLNAALDSAALDAGVFPGDDDLSPIGSYARNGDASHERLCLVAGRGTAGALRFGLSVLFGGDQQCGGTGTAARAGGVLRLAFDRAPGCAITAQYESDRIVLPGTVPPACRRLCTEHGSLAGVVFPRAGTDEATARALTDGDGNPLCR